MAVIATSIRTLRARALEYAILSLWIGQTSYYSRQTDIHMVCRQCVF